MLDYIIYGKIIIDAIKLLDGKIVRDVLGGGGGEGAGSAEAGHSATDRVGATGVADGGDGADGGIFEQPGLSATEIGGGGGGAGHDGGAGGDGADGCIILTWSEVDGIYVSKANLYSVLAPPSGVDAAKVNMYSVLCPNRKSDYWPMMVRLLGMDRYK